MWRAEPSRLGATAPLKAEEQRCFQVAYLSSMARKGECVGRGRVEQTRKPFKRSPIILFGRRTIFIMQEAVTQCSEHRFGARSEFKFPLHHSTCVALDKTQTLEFLNPVLGKHRVEGENNIHLWWYCWEKMRKCMRTAWHPATNNRYCSSLFSKVTLGLMCKIKWGRTTRNHFSPGIQSKQKQNNEILQNKNQREQSRASELQSLVTTVCDLKQ